MPLHLNLNASAKIGLASLFVILMATHRVVDVHKARTEDAQYAERGVTTQAVVIDQSQTTKTVGTRRHRYEITTDEVMVAFKLPNGTPVYKTADLYFPSKSITPDGPAMVEVTYLPEDPSGSARVRGEIRPRAGDGSKPMWPGILGVMGGLGGLGLACYRERAAWRRLFGRGRESAL